MSSYDASASLADLELPLDALGEVARVLGDTFVVIGAHARDLTGLVVAGLPPIRRTLDLDVTVASNDRGEFFEAVSPLEDRGGSAVRYDARAIGDATLGHVRAVLDSGRAPLARMAPASAVDPAGQLAALHQGLGGW